MKTPPPPTITIILLPAKIKQAGVRKKSGFKPKPIGPIAKKCEKTYVDADAPVLYWMKMLNDYRRNNKLMVLGISFEHLDCIIRVFLAACLPLCKVVEDCRDDLPGNQMKLVPLCPDHPSKRFRIIQLWGNENATNRTTRYVAPAKKEAGDTVLTRFWNQNKGKSSTRRWLRRRPSPLQASLDVSKLFERYGKILTWIEEHEANRQEWEDWDDRLNTLDDETMMDYCNRVERLTTRQNW